ncbi:hypothetical protein [Methylocystis hirsuta]|uniref:hypothetical protein n=1 Tax=Methylocystis hirsuta TaxID=369798 RepID=UPI0014740536|nr:hypothetical protein [Methylocystis hirsuta]
MIISKDVLLAAAKASFNDFFPLNAWDQLDANIQWQWLYATYKGLLAAHKAGEVQ